MHRAWLPQVVSESWDGDLSPELREVGGERAEGSTPANTHPCQQGAWERVGTSAGTSAGSARQRALHLSHSPALAILDSNGFSRDVYLGLPLISKDRAERN